MVELYIFTFLADIYYFTNANEAILHGGQTYQPLGIERTEFSNDWADNQLTLTVPTKYLPFSLLASTFGNVSLELEIIPYTINYGSTKVKLLTYKVDYAKQSMALSFSISETIGENKIGLRTFSSLCTHTFGDENCGYSGANTVINRDVLSIDTSKTVITVSPAVPAVYRAGACTTNFGEVVNIASVDASGTIVTAITPLLRVPTSLNFKPFCQKTVASCIAFLGTSRNFGGFLHIPIKNPVTGLIGASQSS